MAHGLIMAARCWVVNLQAGPDRGWGRAGVSGRTDPGPGRYPRAERSANPRQQLRTDAPEPLKHADSNRLVADNKMGSVRQTGQLRLPR
jgi:hypothetical protein